MYCPQGRHELVLAQRVGEDITSRWNRPTVTARNLGVFYVNFLIIDDDKFAILI
jgi:hypothetical protein